MTPQPTPPDAEVTEEVLQFARHLTIGFLRDEEAYWEEAARQIQTFARDHAKREVEKATRDSDAAMKALYEMAHKLVQFSDSNEMTMDMEVQCAMGIMHQQITDLAGTLEAAIIEARKFDSNTDHLIYGIISPALGRAKGY